MQIVRDPKQSPVQRTVIEQLEQLSRIRIEHPSWVEATREILDLHALRTVRQEGSGVLILGEAGAGKTTLLKTIEAAFPRRAEPDRTVIPCVYAKVPPRPSIKAMAQGILNAFRDPLAFVTGQTAVQLTHRVVTLAAGCSTELVLLDEIGHLVDGRRSDSLSSAADWLKDLADASHAPHVLAGLPRAEGILEANEQLRRRFAASIALEVVRPSDEMPDLKQFRAVIREIERYLPIAAGSELHAKDMGRRLLFATEGRMGYLMALLARAVRVCRELNQALIGPDVLEIAFRRALWQGAVGPRNPFSPSFNWRRLDGRGEPFAPAIMPRRHAK